MAPRRDNLGRGCLPQLRCADADCDRKTFTEQNPLVEGSLTQRARMEICRAVGEGGHTVAEQARFFAIGWSTAMAAVRDHGSPLVDDPRRLHQVRTLGVDEHKMLAPDPSASRCSPRRLSNFLSHKG